MASVLHKVLRNQPTTRIIARFSKPMLNSPVLNHLNHIEKPHHSTINPCPLGLPKTEESYPSRSFQFYPSFSFGVFLNPVSSYPISSTGLVQSEAGDCGLGDSETIWADSVKKKRKRKMNKHKLKKLRKRLRRKS